MVSVEHRTQVVMMMDHCDCNEDGHGMGREYDVCDRRCESQIYAHRMCQIPNEFVYAAHLANFAQRYFH